MIMLDTHVVIWLAASPEKLSKPASAAISEGRSKGQQLTISSISLYEIARLAERGRITLDSSVESFLLRLELLFAVQPITVPIALAASRFPNTFPGDPADRIIAATALAANSPLVTADQYIRSSGEVTTIW